MKKLIDKFLPQYDFSERHSIKINAPAAKIYQTARTMDFRQAHLSYFLCRLRGLSPAVKPTLESILQKHFVFLGEEPNKELLLGITGKFWTLGGGLKRVAVEDFIHFNRTGYAKAVWDFSLTETGSGTSLLETETRVSCTDETSRSRFRVYWFLIRAFSGLMRREILCVIKRKSEEK